MGSNFPHPIIPTPRDQPDLSVVAVGELHENEAKSLEQAVPKRPRPNMPQKRK